MKPEIKNFRKAFKGNFQCGSLPEPTRTSNGEVQVLVSGFVVFTDEGEVLYSHNLLGHPILGIHELEFVMRHFGTEKAAVTRSHIANPFTGEVVYGDAEALEELEKVRVQEAQALMAELAKERLEEVKNTSRIVTPAQKIITSL